MGRSDGKATELSPCPEGKDYYVGLKKACHDVNLIEIVEMTGSYRELPDFWNPKGKTDRSACLSKKTFPVHTLPNSRGSLMRGCLRPGIRCESIAPKGSWDQRFGLFQKILQHSQATTPEIGIVEVHAEWFQKLFRTGVSAGAEQLQVAGNE